MAKFRCLLTGSIVEFIQPVDIETTQENPAYEELEDEEVQEQETKKEVKKTRKAKVEE